MTIYEAAILGYRIALGALVLLLLVKGNAPMKRTALTLAAVYCIQLGLAGLMWPAPEWSLAMIGVDAFGAFLIGMPPTRPLQRLTAYVFLPQMMFHLARYLLGADANMDHYFWGLTVIAFAQLFLAGGWWFNDRYLRHRGDIGLDQASASPYREGSRA